MRAEGVTDVTVEVFNHCGGSCTGCLLNSQERKATVPVMGVADFASAMEALARYGEERSLVYRPVLVFGDVPWLPADMQKRYYGAAAERGLRIGATMTLVEPDRRGTYEKGLRALLDADPEAVFDITVDPIRLARDPGYAERLRMAVEMAPELHLATLLSEAILTRQTPEGLASSLSDALGRRAVSLGFTPSVARLEGANYGYSVATAAGFTAAFYSATPEGREFLADEADRFRASGAYGEFLKQTFHIAGGLEIFPVAYTAFGDVILDGRNGGEALGSLRREGLSEVLSGRAARRLSAQANAGMDLGNFGCRNCQHEAACTFNGVGAARRLYREFEFRAGACYGPAALQMATGRELGA